MQLKKAKKTGVLYILMTDIFDFTLNDAL